MFGQPSHNERRTEASEPLLGSDDRAALDSDDEDSSALGDRLDHAVRFDDEVQVIGPPLRSMQASRETGVYVLPAAPNVLIIFTRI